MSEQLDLTTNMPVAIEGIDGEKFLIAIVNGDMVNLNDLHVAAGKKEMQSPRRWLKLPSTLNLKSVVAKKYNIEIFDIIKTKRGKGGGTTTHWQLALAYASYLSPEIHLQINMVFKERLEELVDPELSITRGEQRAVDTWKRQGKTPGWIANWLEGISTRKHFTNTLVEHGVKAARDFAEISNVENVAILGETAKAFKKDKGLSKNARVRDHLRRSELAAFSLLEAVTSDKIEDENSKNSVECKKVVTRVSDAASIAYQQLLNA